MLRSQEGEQALPFWLDCTVMNRSEREEGAHITLGLHFNAWAVSHRNRQELAWFNVGEEGAVGPLGAWVLQQQLVQSGHTAGAKTRPA
jgi:hypothetical protein